MLNAIEHGITIGVICLNPHNRICGMISSSLGQRVFWFTLK